MISKKVKCDPEAIKELDWRSIMINIFIGSSSESLDVAEKIKEELKANYNCTIWNNNFFDLNQSTYDTLVRKSIAFDYAIFVGGNDDLVKRLNNQTEKIGIRDNVYLEFGLYAGILGKERTFFFVDSDVKIASDFFGIDIIFYKNPDEVASGCKIIDDKIKKEEKLNRVSLLPSTSLAYDYFNNFLKLLPIHNFELIIPQNSVSRTKINSIKIIIPDNCNTDWEVWAKLFYNAHNYKDAIINQTPRSISIKYDDNALSNNKKLDIYDIPLTLKASFWAVEAVMGKDYVGNKSLLSDAKRKECKNFIKTLKNLINGNSFLSKTTQIITVSDYEQIIDSTE